MNKLAWECIHQVPDTPYVIEKREWPIYGPLFGQGTPDYRFKVDGQDYPCDPIPAPLGLEIERLVAENTRLQAEFRAFVREWSERFGFLASENPRESVESIDEVAQILGHRYPVWNR